MQSLHSLENMRDFAMPKVQRILEYVKTDILSLVMRLEFKLSMRNKFVLEISKLFEITI